MMRIPKAAVCVGVFTILAIGAAAAGAAEAPAKKIELPPREWPAVADGFASVNAMGQNGTTGGAGGYVVTVTTQAELERYAMVPDPCIIRVKGAIKITPKPNPFTRYEKLTPKEIHVTSHKTIIGVGKTGEIVGGGFFLRPGTHNVIIRNLTIRDTYVKGDWAGLTQDDDGLQSDTAHHIWIDHCHFTRHGDGCIDLRAGTTYVTVSWCIFSRHNKTFGIGWDKKVKTEMTLHHNWFRNTGCRNPRAGQVLRAHLYNNYLQNVGTRGQWASDGTHMILQNSLFENVNNPHRGDQTRLGGTLVATGNVYRNCRGRHDTRGTATFDPAKFYKVTLDKAEDLPAILAKYAGPQENIGAPRPGVGPKGNVRPGLRFRYYEAAMQRCADMEGKKPVKQGVIGTPSLDIEGRREEQFGVIYEGFVKIPEEELYHFSIASDDGSVLWLDGRKVVDNDGLHPGVERGKLLSLAAGYHAIKVAFFNGPKGASLSVYWQPPGRKKQLLPAEMLFHAELAGAGESVGWRTDGTGAYPAAKPVLTWSADKNVLWKTRLPSRSNATPVIVGDKLFVCAEPATLVCVDKNDGTILWKQEMIAAEQKSGRPRTQGTNGYTSTTPVTDGRHVFTLNGYGTVAAFDMTGKRVWLTRLKPPNHGWGTSASPVLVDGKVIVHIPPVVTALDAANGKPAWAAKSNGAWGTPLVVTVGGKKAIYTTGGLLIAAADGTVIGRGRALPWTSPISDGKRLYVADIDGAAALDLPAVAAPNARLKEAWRLPVTRPRKRRHYASPLLHDGLLYAVTENGHFTVIDAATGALAYERSLRLGGTTFPSIVLAGEHLLVSSDRGKTVVLKPGHAYAETGRNTLEPFRSTPVFDGDRMYVRGLRHLYCIGKRSRGPRGG